MELIKFESKMISSDPIIAYINPIFSDKFKKMTNAEKKHLLHEIIEEIKWQLEIVEDMIKKEYKDMKNVHPIK